MNTDPDRDDVRAAEALDAFLRAAQLGQPAGPQPALPAAEAALAGRLVQLAAGMHPSEAFARTLETQLRARAARPAARPPRRPVVSRRLAWALAAFVLALAALLAVPQVRASLAEVLRVGAVRLFFGEPTPAPVTGTPRPTPTLLPSLLDLTGETTLADARANVPFPVPVPTYPPDLGAPHYVYVQDLGGPAVVLVWVDPAQPKQVRLSLHLISSEMYAQKGDPTVLAQTQVQGHLALWTTGPYVLEYKHGAGSGLDVRHLVTGHVLLWEDGGVTYRLETSVTMEEAVRIAESLRAEP